ncbi:hypothetical protein [Agathobacter sp.]|uniref:hypothetical protein n=1 Tax=Agathobacter sp. TaxID=2021311 RepID=UPI003FD80680
MAVLRKEHYRQKDGTDILKVYTKPSSKFPNGGYFYVDAEKEANESAEAHMQEIDEKLAKQGIFRKQIVSKPKVTYDKDGDEIADMNNILNMFSASLSADCIFKSDSYNKI